MFAKTCACVSDMHSTICTANIDYVSLAGSMMIVTPIILIFNRRPTTIVIIVCLSHSHIRINQCVSRPSSLLLGSINARVRPFPLWPFALHRCQKVVFTMRLSHPEKPPSSRAVPPPFCRPLCQFNQAAACTERERDSHTTLDANAYRMISWLFFLAHSWAILGEGDESDSVKA